MNNISKGKSPFYPGQPVPIELFSGRLKEINRIQRSISQVELGKPQAIFLTGEYGIGKSSLAGFMRFYAEKNNDIFGIHVFLGGANSIEQVATKTVEAAISSQTYEPKVSEKVRNVLSKYIGRQELFGISVNFEQLKTDGPGLSKGFLPFLKNLLVRLNENDIKGLMLIFDEINGITGNSQFSHFIKALIDENALSQTPLPILLLLCGVEERRRDMIRHHRPIERIFDVIEIQQMDEIEMKDFFIRSFKSVDIEVESDAMSQLCRFSSGFPKIMHHIGDAVFWANKDDKISAEDAIAGILDALDVLGRQIFDHQVFKALHSEDYHSILKKLGKSDFDLTFHKADIVKGLSDVEKKKFNNFLQRMKKLKILSPGEKQGEYSFNNRLEKLYIRLNSIEKIN